MAQITSVFTVGSRGSKATNSQATPTKASLGESKDKSQASLEAIIAFLRKGRPSADKVVASRDTARKNVTLLQKSSTVPVKQNGGLPQLVSPFTRGNTGIVSTKAAKSCDYSSYESLMTELRLQSFFPSVRYDNSSMDDPSMDKVKDAFIPKSNPLSQASVFQTAFAHEKRFEKRQAAATEIKSTDKTVCAKPCSENVRLVADNLEKKRSAGESELHQESLDEIFGLDLSDTKDLLEDMYSNIDIDSMIKMYLPSEVPSDVNEGLSSDEFSELMKFLDNIEPETLSVSQQSSGTKSAVSKPSKGVSGDEKMPATPQGPWDEYVPDMFLFSETEQEVKFDLFDLFDHDDADSSITCSNLTCDVTSSSRKRKRRDFISAVDSKRQRVSWFESPELVIF